MIADPYIHIRGSITAKNPDGLYRISECVEDMRALSNLDDSIIQAIKHDLRPELKPAQDIIDRVDRRQLVSLKS